MLHFERLLKTSAPPLTSAGLLALLASHSVTAVSKNTAVSHLNEMRAYGLLEKEGSNANKRVRPLVLSQAGEQLVREWYGSHLKSLDLLDGGGRLDGLAGNPHLLHRAHPLAIRALFKEAGWTDPPAAIATFAWVESGSNILHDLFVRVPPRTDLPERIWVGPVRASDITGKYIISRSHAQRLIARARDLQLLGWEKPGNGGSLWISRDLIEAYRHWQAIKFGAISAAWDHAREM